MKWKLISLLAVTSLFWGACDSGGSGSSNNYPEPTVTNVTCSMCNGYGKITCPQCAGQGLVPYYGNYVFCPNCGGNRVVVCASCYGKGTITTPGGSKNISFGSGCSSHNGNKCSVYENGSTCNCSGFNGMNWRPCECSKCHHSAEKHDK